MIDPDQPGSPAFTAPDGLVYVDRAGRSEATARTWREEHDERTLARRATRRTWTAAGAHVAGYVVVGGAAAWGVHALWPSSGVLAVLVLAGVGWPAGYLLADRLVRRSDPPAEPRTVRVPDTVLAHAPQTASPEDLWRWSVAFGDEDGARPVIGYETSVERPADVARAAAARARYTRQYEAYRTAARELGLPVREPAIPLGEPGTH